MTIQDILALLEQKAPLATAENWDNPGLLVGNADRQVKTVLAALDITPDVVRQAKQLGAEMIVAHHPVIFAPLHQLPSDHPVYLLAQHGIAAVCWHTNLDQAQGGVADTLARKLDLQEAEKADGYTRIGRLNQPMTPEQFVRLVESALHTRVRGCLGQQPVSTVAVFGGALDEASLPLLLSADACVFGECKHHVRLVCRDSGKTVCEAGHFASEHPVVEVVAAWLREAFPHLAVHTAQESSPFSVI